MRRRYASNHESPAPRVQRLFSVADCVRGLGGIPRGNGDALLPDDAATDRARAARHLLPHAAHAERFVVLAYLPVHSAAADDAAVRRGTQHGHIGDAADFAAARMANRFEQVSRVPRLLRAALAADARLSADPARLRLADVDARHRSVAGD